jgi:hypothetical protein
MSTGQISPSAQSTTSSVPASSGCKGAHKENQPVTVHEPSPPSHSQRSAAPLRRAWPWWIALAGYFVAVSLGHLEFSLWLVRQREGAFGAYAFKDFVPFIAVAGGVGLALWIGLQARRAARPGPVLGYWAFWALCVALFDRFLTFSVNEYAHYPQYALLAWLLARAIDPDRSRLAVARVLFWATLLGMVDEFQQYVWIAPSYGEHLDFNDFVVNLLGAAAGVLIYYGFAPRRPEPGTPRGFPMPEAVVAGILCVMVAAGLHTGRVVVEPTSAIPPGGIVRDADGVVRLYLQRRPDAFGSVNAGPYRGQYRILDPVSGLALMLGAGLVFATLPRALRPRSSTMREPAYRG